MVAETLDEAAALVLNCLRQVEWGDVLAGGVKLEVQVREPATTHTVTLQQIQRWADAAGRPQEVIKKQRVRELLG